MTEGAEILQRFLILLKAFDSSASSVLLCASVVIVSLVQSPSYVALAAIPPDDTLVWSLTFTLHVPRAG